MIVASHVATLFNVVCARIWNNKMSENEKSGRWRIKAL